MPAATGPLEVAVAAAGNRDQFVRDAGFLQRVLQSHGMLVGHERVGIAVNRDHGRHAGADVGER